MKWQNNWIIIIFLTLLSLPALAKIDENYSQSNLLNIASQDVVASISKKSPQKAFLFSAIMPGTGEFYSGANKRGVFFAASEIAFWSTYIVLHGKAENYQEEYIKFVDDHIVFEDDSPADSTKSWTLEDYEHATQADNWHYVYTETNGKPIDRVGKFYWKDLPKDKIDESGGVPIEESNSESRINAFEKRGLANDKYKQAKIFLGLVVINHVVSAIDARIAATIYNNRLPQNGVGVSFHPTLSPSGDIGGYVKLYKSY